MGAERIKLFGDAIAASRLEGRFARVKATSLLRLAIEDLFPGRIALVSSFGADSAVLLHMIGQIDKTTPVVFVDTGQHFPETLAYRDRLVERLGLVNVVTAEPDAALTRAEDPEKFLFAQRSRSLLRNPQGFAARRGAGGLRRVDHRSKALPELSGRACRCSRRRASALRSIRSPPGAPQTFSVIFVRLGFRRIR